MLARTAMASGDRVMGRSWVVAVLLVFGAGVGCGRSGTTRPGIANPASEYCEELGGTVELITASDGGQSGQCRLPDGRVVDEWTLYRSDHPAASSSG